MSVKVDGLLCDLEALFVDHPKRISIDIIDAEQRQQATLDGKHGWTTGGHILEASGPQRPHP
ncbi:hypothetical protein IscW_ISCW004476 [Ixodes scapularis]|uniref:Uncharacterized protein n=1 Tax=Ixodes scapularis TaxID=6945 RepID=B7PHT0_IXOSC|nr:hypothetical protein IscW_ISCW004476 [Ixodes scapularis]|eukprot:XP_002403496.1 hypothetical protein IscW_ISCW004476 [Ixodes scapularis]